MITIIAIGKKHEDWVREGIERYQKRLSVPFNVEWILLPHSSLKGLSAREEESQRILQRLPAKCEVVLLDETGTLRDTPTLAQYCERTFTQSRPLVIIIGGAYGVNDTLHARADTVWSLSPLVFPHQLVRLILIEQLYRAQEITKGNPYHHV